MANIQHNVQEASLSLSCNLDLQVAHSRLLWKETFRPVLLVAQALMVRVRGTLAVATCSPD